MDSGVFAHLVGWQVSQCEGEETHSPRCVRMHACCELDGIRRLSIVFSAEAHSLLSLPLSRLQFKERQTGWGGIGSLSSCAPPHGVRPLCILASFPNDWPQVASSLCSLTAPHTCAHTGLKDLFGKVDQCHTSFYKKQRSKS